MGSQSIGLSFDEMVEIYNASDSSYDGVFYTAVKSTGIYCRPSCRSRKPNRENVTFYQTPREAEDEGFRACKRCRPDKIHFNPKMELVSNAKTYINQHYKEKLTLEQIAHHVGSSSYYLGRLFKEKTSETPRSYLEKVRIDKAEHLLKTTAWSITDICFEAGFQNASSFYSAFQRLKQCSPKQYREDVGDDLR
ncbi:MAG TPA: Ada metal-binding domain-containing protein [Bacillales bacterium]|nr:Ada metal-binding domain-containing protein [Bacillales bacterium]